MGGRGGLVARGREGESRMTGAVESEKMGLRASLARAGLSPHSEGLDRGEPMTRLLVHDTEEPPPIAPKPGPNRVATFWAWECRRCGKVTLIWNRARAVRCYSPCNSYGFRVALKQWPNEALEALEARLARRDVTT